MDDSNFDNSFISPVSLPNSADQSQKAASGLDTSNQSSISEESMAISETIEYKPLSYHWFYTSYLLDKLIWLPFSNKDSLSIENVYTKHADKINELASQNEVKRTSTEFLVLVKGGRFEVDLVESTKRSIYWDDKNVSNVRRCLWFYRESNEQRFIPYELEYSEFLEREYEKTINTNAFHKRIDFLKVNKIVSSDSSLEKQPSITCEEAFVFHSTSIMLHFTQANMLDELGNLNSDAKRPRIVKRGLDEVVEKVEPDEIDQIDHLCFVVHGIGEGCDLKFRPIVDCVDDFRDIGALIIDQHLKNHVTQNNLSGRVEFLPISWHHELHGDDSTGIDGRLKPITLPSIPKLRQYSNSTILDVLFYTSPIYCQTILSKVGNEINRLRKIFMERNPYFKGKISLVGHSLGSLIVFDLLSHQFDNKTEETLSKSASKTKLDESSTRTSVYSSNEGLDEFLKRLNLSEYKILFEKEKISIESLSLLGESDLIQLGLPMGPRKILLDEFKNNALRREREEVERKIKDNLETLKKQELEQKAQIDQNQRRLGTNKESEDTGDYFSYGLAGTGQLHVKYPQLDFSVANFFALGSPIPMFLTVRGIEKLEPDFKLPKCDGFFNIFHPFDPVAYRLEPLVQPSKVLKPVLMPHHKGRKRMHLELMENFQKVSVDFKQKMYGQFKNAWSSLAEFTKIPAKSGAPAIESTKEEAGTSEIKVEQLTSAAVEIDEQQEKEPETESLKIDWGKLNKGRRIDYVLQERPIESFNEYLFALASHACYWESEDTLLLIIKELYEVENMVDANTELLLTEQQQIQSSWLTQAATSAISSNVQKTFSYFNIGLPQSLTSVLTSTLTSSLQGNTQAATSNNQNPTSNSSNK